MPIDTTALSVEDQSALLSAGLITRDNELTPLGTISANLSEAGLDPATRAAAIRDFNSGYLNPDLSFTETGELHYMDKETAVHRGRDTFRAWYLQGGWDRHKDSQPDNPFYKQVGDAVKALSTKTIPQAIEGAALAVGSATGIYKFFGQDDVQKTVDATVGASSGMFLKEMARNTAMMILGNNLVWATGYTAATGDNEPEISALYDFERGMSELDQTTSADAAAALTALSHVVEPDDEKAEMGMLEAAQRTREGVELARQEVGNERLLQEYDERLASFGELAGGPELLAGGLASFVPRKVLTAGGRATAKRIASLNREIVEKTALRQTAENALKADNAAMILKRKTAVDRVALRKQIQDLSNQIDELAATAEKVANKSFAGGRFGQLRDSVRDLGNKTRSGIAGSPVGTIGTKIDNYFTAPRGLPGHAKNIAAAGGVLAAAELGAKVLDAVNLPGGEVARFGSKALALGYLAPTLYGRAKTLARTTHAMGASYVARRSTVPYWRKVSQRMADNKLVSGAALTMDVFAKPLVPVANMGKAAGRSMRAELPFNFIASGGQEGWLAETVAESLVFGFPGQVQGLIHGMGGMPAVMQKAEFDQLAANDAAELRRYLPARHQQAFDTLNPSVRRIVGVYSAMFPDLEFRFQPAPGNTTGSGYDRYTDTVYIDPNSRRPFDALIAHEVAHGVQERGFDKIIIDKLVGQDGLLRNEDGSLTSDALKFKAEYESLVGRQIDDETLAREWFAESSVPGLMRTQQLQRLVRRNPITRSLAESLLPKIPFGKRILQRSGILLDQNGSPVKGQGSMQALTQASPGVARIIDRYLRAVAGESRPSDTKAAVEKARARPLTREERENADRRNQIDFQVNADGSQKIQNGRRVPVDRPERRQRETKLGQEIEKLAEEISFADPDRMPEKMSLVDKINLFNEEEWTKLIDRLEKAGIYNPSQLALFREVFKRKAIGNSESLLFDYQPAIKTKGRSKRYESREAELITGAIYEIKVTKAKNVVLNIIDMDFLEQRAMKAATTKLGKELYPGGTAAIMRDVMILAENHVNNVPNATVFTKTNQLNFLNGILGKLSKEHQANNPLAKGQAAVRTLRLDRINQAEGLQQKGLPFIPDKWRDNLLPEPQDAITPQTDAARQDRVDRLPEEDSGFGAQEGELPVGGRRGVGGDQGWVPAPDSPYPPASRPPLDGLPQTVKVNGKQVVFGPFQPARQAAEDYMAGAGLEYVPPTTYAKVDRQRATRIASAYERMPHAPNDPEVRESYRAMIDETLAQYEALKATGLVVEPNPPNTDPYGNPRNAILDVVENNHMWFFPTNEGFGGDAVSDVDVAENPLLEETGEVINGYRMTANDVFRVVHDYFGHIKEGNGFRAGGEENAWRAHSAMYSPKARRAMTSETRGQNSWVNYGPHGEFNRTASGADTEYAAQKTGLLPEWVAEEGAGDDIRRMPEQLDADHRAAEQAGDFEAGQALVDEAARMEGFNVRAFHQTPEDFTVFDLSKTGRGPGGPNTVFYRPAAYFTLDGPEIRKLMEEIPAAATAYGVKEMNVYLKMDPEADYIPDGLELSGSEVAVTDSNRIKSADPFTYDNQDKLIPLSERFNPESDDIRRLPEPKATIEQFKGQNIQVLTSDMSIVKDIAQGDQVVAMKGGPGFLDNRGWGFTDKVAANGFRNRWLKAGKPLIGLTTLSPDNHLNSSDVRRSYALKWKNAIDTGQVSKTAANKHIRQAMLRILASKSKKQDSSINKAKVFAKKIKTVDDLLEIFPTMPWTLAGEFWTKFALKRALPISVQKRQEMGLDNEGFAKEHRQPEFGEAGLGELFAVARYDGSDPVYRPDLNTAYPWFVSLPDRAVLEEMVAVNKLTTDDRVFYQKDIERGQLEGQPLMITGVILDKVKEGVFPGPESRKRIQMDPETPVTPSDPAEQIIARNPEVSMR